MTRTYTDEHGLTRTREWLMVGGKKPWLDGEGRGMKLGMSSKPTPPPESALDGYGCGITLVVMSALWATVVIRIGILGLLVACIPAVIVILYWLYWRILLIIEIVTSGRRGIRGIIVTSASPNWSEYIENQWLSRFGDQFHLLNWSERTKWEKTLPVRLFHHFSYTHNYCPSIILFRGLRQPLVFRFFYAFRDYKHGNDAALRRLEERLFRELALK